jgi:hypothetical protein
MYLASWSVAPTLLLQYSSVRRQLQKDPPHQPVVTGSRVERSDPMPRPQFSQPGFTTIAQIQLLELVMVAWSTIVWSKMSYSGSWSGSVALVLLCCNVRAAVPRRAVERPLRNTIRSRPDCSETSFSWLVYSEGVLQKKDLVGLRILSGALPSTPLMAPSSSEQ